MSDEINLVRDLAVILIAAGVFTVLFKALKQPLILGYLIAGFVVGPHLGLFHITSTAAVHNWSELGIIFLLFALGLDFSFKKLLKVGSSAFIIAGINCVGMFGTGLLAGQLLHWSMMESIFLGGLLSMSSTTIIIKAFGDMGLKDKPYAQLIFGVLVVEDLIAVLLMVLLSTLAATGHFAGGKMLLALGKLAFFLVLWFLVGIYVIPSLLKWIKPLLNDETLLIIAIGLCFGMVTLADSVGFSSALGAFVMGSILAETLEGAHIEKLMGSIKDLFGAIFFVSVGMMIDPAVIGAHWGTILALTIIAMVGITIFASTGTILAGKGLDTAVHTGMSLAQLGEFSFIIASLGCSLGVLREFIYPVIISVSVITTFTTPYMIKAADPALKWLRKVLPQQFQDRIDAGLTEQRTSSGIESGEWRELIKMVILRVVIYAVLLLAIQIGSHVYLDKLTANLLPEWSETGRGLLNSGLTLLVMLPFLYGMISTSSSMEKSEYRLVQKNRSNSWALLSIDLGRILIAGAFVIAAITAHFDLAGLQLLLVMLAFLLLAIPMRKIFKRHLRMEARFFENLSATDRRARELAPVSTSVREKLERYNVETRIVYLRPESQFAGKTLKELPFRHSTGVNIIKIQRGGKSITVPSGDEPVYPFDRIVIVGTDKQVADFMEEMAGEITLKPVLDHSGSKEEDFTIKRISLKEDDIMTGKSLRSLDLRKHGLMVISVLRADSIQTNPKADFHFESGDTVWIAGDASSVRAYFGV